MKITILGVTFEPTKEDFARAKQLLVNAWNWFDERIAKELLIVFADKRYYITGYLISWGKIKISIKQLEELCSIERYWAVGLSDYLTEEEYKKYVLEDSGELNGYETDTPENFDIMIEI
jgi:hypothetical protein